MVETSVPAGLAFQSAPAEMKPPHRRKNGLAKSTHEAAPGCCSKGFQRVV